MYLHELGDEAASFTKEEMQVKCGNNSLASPSKDMDLFERQSSKAAPFYLLGGKTPRVRAKTPPRPI